MDTIILIVILILIFCCGVILYYQRHKIKIDVTEFKDPDTGKDYRDTGHLIIYVDNNDVSPALVPDDTAIIRQNIKISDLNVGDVIYTNYNKFYRIKKIDMKYELVDLENTKNTILKDQPISTITGKLVGKAIS
jgi:hypothetical protein